MVNQKEAVIWQRTVVSAPPYIRTMDSKAPSRRVATKPHPVKPTIGGRRDDHRQTMNSVLGEERPRAGGLSNPERIIKERDHLHRNRNQESLRQHDNVKVYRNFERDHDPSRSSSTNRGEINNNSTSTVADRSHNIKERHLELGHPDSRAAKVPVMKKTASGRALVTPTGTQKPPLKPRRHSKSVTSSTKSTSSATYVSSDSSEGEKDDDDDSIETPDIRIRVYDHHGRATNNNSWSSSSSLAAYESTDDNSRFAMVPFQEKKKKKSRSRQPSYKKPTKSSSDDDDVDPFFYLGSSGFPADDDFANVYNLSSSETDSSDDKIVDLDEMIAETSARWKTAVTAIVTNTVTATSTSKGSLMITNPDSSAAATGRSSIKSQSKPRKDSYNSRGHTASRPDALVASRVDESEVIEKQQAEIEKLRAALKAQRQQPSHFHHRFSTEMLVLPETSEFEAPHANYNFHSFASQDAEDITIDCVPLEHIEVNHDASDPNSSHYWQDDLTVWSGFNTVTGGMDNVSNAHNHEWNEKVGSGKPPLTRRPDAASNTGASALNGIAVRVVEEMKVDLSSGMTGVIRKAVYSGTINAHTRLPEGQGTFRFLETGDTYQGEVHAGQMHGAGTYTFGRANKKTSSKSKRPKELKGTFENNVFIG